MTKQKCPLCNQEVDTWPHQNMTYRSYDCPCCGWFILRDFPHTDIALIRDEAASYFYYTGNHHFHKPNEKWINYVGGQEYFDSDFYQERYLNSHFITKEDILSFYPKSLDERISRILLGFEKQSKFFGNIITLSRDELISALFVKRFTDDAKLLDENDLLSQLRDITDYLDESKYIEIGSGKDNLISIKLLPDGWKIAEELKKDNEKQRNELCVMPLEQLTDVELRKLINSAEEFYEKGEKQLALEKLWDAFERMKTYYTTLDKKNSANKIVNNMSLGIEDYRKLYADEFKALTDIGNGFRIRHHETDTISIEDERHLDYFYLRCMSLLSTAVKFL